MGKTNPSEERTSKKERKSKKAPKETKLGAEEEADASAKGDTMAVDVSNVEEIKKPKKKSKKRHLEHADTTGPEEPGTSRKKRRKNGDINEVISSPAAMDVERANETDSLPPAVDTAETGSFQSENKEEKERAAKKDMKRKKKESAAVLSLAESASPQTKPATSEDASSSEPQETKDEKKTKRRKEKKDDSRNSNDADVSSTPKKKKSKSKSSGPQASVEPSSSPKPRKNTTDFPDPEIDESLNPQARKALAYAFSQFSDPTDWKFNKAKQNWLIRNVLSDESITDLYFPLAIKYLSQLQGGSRDKLKETCTSVLAKPAPEVEATDASAAQSSEPQLSTETADTPPKPKSILKSTTTDITQPMAGAIIVAAPQAPKSPVADIKKQRAQLLLNSLT